MSVRYPSLARRRQVSRARDAAMAEAVAASVGFMQEPVARVDREAPPWPPVPPTGKVEVYDLDKWAHPGRTNAAVGPFYVACGMCPHVEHAGTWDDAEHAQGAHYTKHYQAGETS